MITPPDSQGTSLPSYDPGARLHVERRHDGEMIVFTFSGSIDDSIVDTWRSALDAYIEQRPGALRHCVYDLAGITDWGLSPRAREKLSLGAVRHPDARGRVAIITPPIGPLRAVVDLFIRSQLSAAQPQLELRLFSEREVGIAWVGENITPGDR
jgi:hypothetical protein